MTAAAELLADLDMLCDIEAELRDATDDEKLANVHRIRLSALMLARTHVARALPSIIEEAAEPLPLRVLA